MLTRKTFGIIAIALAGIGGIACGNASAMARGHAGTGTGTGTGSGTAVNPPPAAVTIDPAAGDFADGYRLGQRNGQIIVERLKQRTIDAAGCEAVDELQRGLLAVTRTIRPPADSEDGMVSGFYSGYFDAVRAALGTVRRDCDDLAYSSGEFPGELYGAVVCQISSVDAAALAGLQLQPLYSGWSGGSSEVLKSCRTTLEATVQSCIADGGVPDDAAAQAICADSSSL